MGVADVSLRAIILLCLFYERDENALVGYKLPMKNKDNMKHLISIQPKIIIFFTEYDIETAIYAVESNGSYSKKVLKCIVEKYPNYGKNKTLIMGALGRNGGALEYAHYYNDDEEMVMLAIANSPEAIEYASDRLKEDKDFCFKIVTKQPNSFKCMISKFTDDDEFIGKFLKISPEYIKYVKEIKPTVKLVVDLLQYYKDYDDKFEYICENLIPKCDESSLYYQMAIKYPNKAKFLFDIIIQQHDTIDKHCTPLYSLFRILVYHDPTILKDDRVSNPLTTIIGLGLLDADSKSIVENGNILWDSIMIKKVHHAYDITLKNIDSDDSDQEEVTLGNVFKNMVIDIIDALTYIIRGNYTKFERKEMEFVPPSIFFGDMLPIIKGYWNAIGLFIEKFMFCVKHIMKQLDITKNSDIYDDIKLRIKILPELLEDFVGVSSDHEPDEPSKKKKKKK
jgi:hypothetical protein